MANLAFADRCQVLTPTQRDQALQRVGAVLQPGDTYYDGGVVDPGETYYDNGQTVVNTSGLAKVVITAMTFRDIGWGDGTGVAIPDCTICNTDIGYIYIPSTDHTKFINLGTAVGCTAASLPNEFRLSDGNLIKTH